MFSFSNSAENSFATGASYFSAATPALVPGATFSEGESVNSLAANAATARPRVLIVPNSASWIIGQMAMHIIRRFSDRYEFWMLTDKMIRLRPDLARTLLAQMDFIFPLTDKAYQLLRKAAEPAPLPHSLLWIHHVTTWNPAMRDAVLHSSALIACTAGWKTQIGLQAPPNVPVTIVPHGVDADVLRRVIPQRPRFGMPAGAFVVGFVGNKTSNYDEGRKGLDTLQFILESARERIPNLHISFLGLGWEEEVAALRERGISSNYVGFIPESQLAEFYSSVDAYLLTSRVEGGPCTVLEAMACETPVVATRVGLVPEVIADGISGFSADIGDPEALLSHLCELWSSPALRKQIGAAARATVVSSRSWDETLKQLDEPMARMQACSTRKLGHASTASGKRSKNLTGAVHAVDGLLWALVSWWQNLVAAPAAIRMVRACWEGYGFMDVLRGIGLVTRVSFRPGSLRKLLEKSQRSPLTSRPQSLPGPSTSGTGASAA